MLSVEEGVQQEQLRWLGHVYKISLGQAHMKSFRSEGKWKGEEGDDHDEPG